jgi:hypothetical protein
MFLPVMAQANIELEKQIAGCGSESVVIDSTMLNNESSDEEEDEEVSRHMQCIFIYENIGHYNCYTSFHALSSGFTFEGGEGNRTATEEGTQKAPMIKIDFALGDFDGTPIALAEEEKDENPGTTGSSSGNRDARKEGSEEESSDDDDDAEISKLKAVHSIFKVDK